MNEETALQRAPVDFFLDRLQDMPDIEAIQEIDIRLDAMAVKRKSLAGKQDAKIDTLRQSMNCDQERLRKARHLMVMRFDALKWSRAVRSIFGDEGVEKCRIWMAQMGEKEMGQVKMTVRSPR